MDITLKVDGLDINEEDEDLFNDDAYDFDIDLIKEEGLQVVFVYIADWGKGSTYNREELWYATMSYDDLKTYLKYKKEHNLDKDCYEDIKRALPEWADNVYEGMVSWQTHCYRSVTEPEDDDYDEVMAEDWSITNNGSITILPTCYLGEKKLDEYKPKDPPLCSITVALSKDQLENM